MTTIDLHKILDDETRELSLGELKQVIYDEMIECARQSTCVEYNGVSINKVAVSNEINPYWKGKENAFQIVLDLLEHFGENEPHAKFKVGDTVYYIRTKGFGRTTKEAGEPIIAQGVIWRVYKGRTKTTYYVRDRKIGLEENRLYADKSEAEHKLKEIRYE